MLKVPQNLVLLPLLTFTYVDSFDDLIYSQIFEKPLFADNLQVYRIQSSPF